MKSGTGSTDKAVTTAAGSAGTCPVAGPKSARRMLQCTLGGQHEYRTESGQRVQIWSRDDKFMARARWNGQQIGVTLGDNEEAANHRLQRLLIELEDGTFVPGNEARQRQISRRPIPKMDLRSQVSEFLATKRRLRGIDTAGDYKNRLMHVLDFAEQPVNQRKWPLARDLNPGFAVALREFLFVRDVTPNGRDGAERRKMSPKMVRLCLEALRAVLNWAVRADVRKLPAEFANPITDELLGPKPIKDPLRTCAITMQHRTKMIEIMDEWQLLNLAPLLLLPTRFEDVAGALVSDFDLELAMWRLGSRCGGSDFNKSRVNVQMPLPAILVGLLRQTIGGRTDGPMFRKRQVWNAKKRPVRTFANQDEFESLYDQYLRKAKKTEIGNEQDRKKVIRKMIRDCGGVTTDEISSGLKQLMAVVGINDHVPPYQIRAAVTTELHRAGVRHLELRYLTMHSPNDILNEYTSLDPRGEMEKYFEAVKPLLQTLVRRAAVFGFTIEEAGF